MRKITRDAVNAFAVGTPFKRDNTEVVVSPSGEFVTMLLHGNPIARRFGDDVRVGDGGYPSMPTKERINGVISHYLGSADGVYQHKGKWFWKGGEPFQKSGAGLAWNAL